MSEKILVYDDEVRLVSTYTSRLQSLSFLKERFKVEPITPTDFEKEMKTLEERRKAFRKKEIHVLNLCLMKPQYSSSTMIYWNRSTHS